MPIEPVSPGPGQESVWQYPRPPRLERTERHLQVVLGGEVIADTRRGWRVLETSHPPVYYFPPDDIRWAWVRESPGGSVCEWKGVARYFDVAAGGILRPRAGWSYPDPLPAFESIRDHLAFYAHPMDRCTEE